MFNKDRLGEPYDNEHCRIAAKMLTDNENDVGLLHYEFIKYLNYLATLIEIAEGHLASRQIIALAIATWEMHTGLSAIGTG